MEGLMQQVVDCSVELCFQHGLKQTIIYDNIRDALKDKVKDLPKQQVLYNACYGGFGFSKEFNAFYLQDEDRSINKNDYDKRQVAIQYIIPFAKHVIDNACKQQSYLRDMLYVVHKYRLNKVFTNIAHITKTENDLQLMNNNIQILREYLNNNPAMPDKAHPISHWVLMFVKPNFPRYSPEDLQTLLSQYDEGELQKQYTDKKHQLEQESMLLLQHEHIYREIKSFTKARAETKDINTYSSRTYEQSSFLKLMSKHRLDNMRTWSNQSYYEKVAIDFIIEKYKSADYISDEEQSKVYDVLQEKFEDVDDGILTQALERFGLLCASSTYAKLEIAKLSALLEWKIAEYDGLERVYIV
jgi:hypothetical protein